MIVDEIDGHEFSQTWELQPIAGLIGAEVRGFDLREALTPEQADDIRWLLGTYSVLVFSGQKIGADEHVAFAKGIGDIKMPNAYLDKSARVEGHPEIATFSTENKYAYQTDRWHADVTMLAEPNRYSILHMQQVPGSGGDTQWSSDYAAYDRLSEPMKRFVEPLTVQHQHPFVEERRHVHPLVLAHPLTGRRALFLNNTHAKRIVELSEGESAALLKYFSEHGTQPEMICRWRWTEGDLAIWENHYVQHYAIYDYGTQPRKIHRIEVDAEAPRGAETEREVA